MKNYTGVGFTDYLPARLYLTTCLFNACITCIWLSDWFTIPQIFKSYCHFFTDWTVDFVAKQNDSQNEFFFSELVAKHNLASDHISTKNTLLFGINRTYTQVDSNRKDGVLHLREPYPLVRRTLEDVGADCPALHSARPPTRSVPRRWVLPLRAQVRLRFVDGCFVLDFRAFAYSSDRYVACGNFSYAKSLNQV